MAHKIKNYPAETFRRKYINHSSLTPNFLGQGFGKFFIVRVQEMYRLMKLPIPPTRTTTHTFIFLTAGEANMHIGSEHFRIGKHECLFVPAGQVFSFGDKTLDQNEGFLCNFHAEVFLSKYTKPSIIQEFEFLNVWGNPKIILKEQTAHFVLFLVTRLFIEYQESGLHKYDLVQSYLITLLREINSAYLPRGKGSSTRFTFLTNRFKELLHKKC